MFEDSNEAKHQIFNDKHTLLEGYITEDLYEKQFLYQRPGQYTSGWWSADLDSQKVFFVVKEKLNYVDWSVIKTLSNKYPCWQAYPEKDIWYFSNGSVRISMQDFLVLYHLRKKEPNLVADSDTRDFVRQLKCADYFETHNILQKVAIERFFANEFLSVYFHAPVNIDFFVQRNNGQLCALEVKYKFESRNGKFGINCGQYSLFKLLENAKIQIQHWILYNWTHDDQLSIFGFLGEDMEKYWLSGRIDTNLTRTKKTAPQKTSVRGSKRQGYYEL